MYILFRENLKTCVKMSEAERKFQIDLDRYCYLILLFSWVYCEKKMSERFIKYQTPSPIKHNKKQK